MAKKPATRAESTSVGTTSAAADLQRPAAEVLYADELEKLAARDGDRPRPKGWRLAPQSVLSFVLGDESLRLAPKFVGSRAFLERAIVALATNRGLMLIGEPGTAKSYLSEQFPEIWLYFLGALFIGAVVLFPTGIVGTIREGIEKLRAMSGRGGTEERPEAAVNAPQAAVMSNE